LTLFMPMMNKRLLKLPTTDTEMLSTLGSITSFPVQGNVMTTCDCCGEETYRRFHCPECGKMVCWECKYELGVLPVKLNKNVVVRSLYCHHDLLAWGTTQRLTGRMESHVRLKF